MRRISRELSIILQSGFAISAIKKVLAYKQGVKIEVGGGRVKSWTKFYYKVVINENANIYTL